jgi:hypothetical protein
VRKASGQFIGLANRWRLLTAPAAPETSGAPLRQLPTSDEVVLDLAFRIRLMQITGNRVDLFSLRWGGYDPDDAPTRADPSSTGQASEVAA